MNALLFETLISLSVQALCMLTHTIGFAPFVVVLFVSVVLLDLRLLLDSDPLAPARHLGVVCLVLWAGWLGYLHLVQSVEPWRALAYSPSVLVVTRLSFKHSSKRRVFTLIMLAEALIMQKTDAPPAALAFQAHPKPHKVTKHRPKGAKRRHFFKKKHKAVTAVPRFFA